MWFRRDLRLHDNPALLAACAADEVVPLFVLDPYLWDRAGAVRRAYLAASLRCLDESLGGALVVRRGDPRDVVPQGRARGRGADRAPSPPTTGRTARAATRRSSEAAARAPGGDPAAGLSVRRGTRPGEERQRQTRTRSTRRSSEPGPSTAGGTPSTRPAAPDVGGPPLRQDPGRTAAPGHRDRRGRREGCPPGVEEVPRRRRSTTTTRAATSPGATGSAGCRRTSAGARSTPDDARSTSPGSARPRRRPTARSWPGASSTPTCCGTDPRPRARTSARASRR